MQECVYVVQQSGYARERREHWNTVAQNPVSSNGRRAYHSLLAKKYRLLIPEHSRVLELGCGQGDLLAALNPSYGLGVDLSPNMIELAKRKHPGLVFNEMDVQTGVLEGEFDFIILSDVLNDLWDVQRVFERLKPCCHSGTRIIINVWSRVWQIPLSALRNAGFAQPLLEQNWFSPDDITNVLKLTGFELITDFGEILLPLDLPFLSTVFNRYLSKLPFANAMCLTHFFVARPELQSTNNNRKMEMPAVSVVVPARNEAGHISDIIARIPEMGAGTEIVFVEGNSTDDTWKVIQEEVAKYPDKKIKTLQQKGKGKGDAVRCGFAVASGDILMILDADLTVPPEDLPLFFDALQSGNCEFANGVRLVYPMEKKAMQFSNLVANKLFSILFSWLIGQSIKDTLCGTKVLRKEDYQKIVTNRNFFGDFDPFGDFDLIFGAAKLNLKIRDIPIRYRDRVYGETNIRRWSHGFLLLRMVLFAANRIKFV